MINVELVLLNFSMHKKHPRGLIKTHAKWNKSYRKGQKPYEFIVYVI